MPEKCGRDRPAAHVPFADGELQRPSWPRCVKVIGVIAIAARRRSIVSSPPASELDRQPLARAWCARQRTIVSRGADRHAEFFRLADERIAGFVFLVLAIIRIDDVDSPGGDAELDPAEFGRQARALIVGGGRSE